MQHVYFRRQRCKFKWPWSFYWQKVHNAARPEQSLSAEEVLGISHDTKQVIAKGTEQPSPILKSNKMGETHEKDLVKLKTIKTVKKVMLAYVTCSMIHFKTLLWQNTVS